MLNIVKYFLFYIFKILICENELVLGAWCILPNNNNNNNNNNNEK